MHTANPLAHGNRLQRAYYRWALPHYERIGTRDPDLRECIEEIDQTLYTRRGLGVWAGWAMGGVGCGLGLHAAGLPGWHALGITVVLWVGLSLAGVSAWVGARQRPAVPRPPVSWGKRVAAGLVLGALPGLAGLLVGARVARGELALADVVEVVSRAAPAFALGLLGWALLFAMIWQISRRTYEQRLERLRLQRERDAATAQALEADLRLLQAQVQPHFVFNTLATLQHWVDKGDPRAGAMLRELTGFLRRSTEMLGRSTVPLDEELQAVRHYLSILQQRLGARLAWTVDADPALGATVVPPGLLLTLVENAIEHGLEPKIGGGHLHVVAERLPAGWRLRVVDDGVGLRSGTTDGVGLQNLRRRLRLHHGDTAHLSVAARPEGGTVAEVGFA
jgi:hypothetical protein